MSANRLIKIICDINDFDSKVKSSSCDKQKSLIDEKIYNVVHSVVNSSDPYKTRENHLVAIKEHLYSLDNRHVKALKYVTEESHRMSRLGNDNTEGIQNTWKIFFENLNKNMLMVSILNIVPSEFAVDIYECFSEAD